MPAKKRVKSKKAHSKKTSDNELKQLKKEFDAIDIDHSGELDVLELTRFMDKNKFESEFATLAVKIFDTDGNGQISFDEFVQFTRALSRLDQEPDLLHKMLFQTLDKDRSGDLDEDEILSFINSFSPEPVSDEDVLNIIDNLDKNGDGKLSYEELMSIFQQ